MMTFRRGIRLFSAGSLCLLVGCGLFGKKGGDGADAEAEAAVAEVAEAAAPPVSAPAASNENDIPAFPEWDDPSYRKIFCGPYDGEASAPRFVEIFLDVAHFPFVHEGRLGVRAHTDIADYDASDVELQEGDCVLAYTDALMEAQDADGEIGRDKRLAGTARSRRDADDLEASHRVRAAPRWSARGEARRRSASGSSSSWSTGTRS